MCKSILPLSMSNNWEHESSLNHTTITWQNIYKYVFNLLQNVLAMDFVKITMSDNFVDVGQPKVFIGILMH